MSTNGTLTLTVEELQVFGYDADAEVSLEFHISDDGDVTLEKHVVTEFTLYLEGKQHAVINCQDPSYDFYMMGEGIGKQVADWIYDREDELRYDAKEQAAQNDEWAEGEHWDARREFKRLGE